ncbi:hypothetical protein [Ruminococcus sp. 5_1_39BFAA]|uniref:hypothetical protein n=1 Tax=Ruminococcus sp. 5_1_39BFAA TaxID=457412 RepID=UPI003569DDD0
MRLLIVNTLSKDDPAALEAIQELCMTVPDCKVIHVYEMDIRPCVGCNFCWLKTPGICSIKDGYEEILKGYLAYDAIISIADEVIDVGPLAGKDGGCPSNRTHGNQKSFFLSVMPVCITWIIFQWIFRFMYLPL